MIVDSRMTEENNASQDKFQAPRGTRDFYGAEKRLRDAILAALRDAFDRYGFEPLETPAFENIDVLTAKFAGGEEILKETYAFEDQGGRKLGLRYDVTVPLCRFMAERNDLPMPFKRYAIGSVWRDGPLKKGRYREFVQCDVDTVGSDSMANDAELCALACDALSGLKLGFTIQVNNRKLLNGLLLSQGVTRELLGPAILSLDKLAKIGAPAVAKEMTDKGVPEAVAAEVVAILSANPSLESLARYCVNDEAIAGKKELEEFFKRAEEFGCGSRVVFSATLSRGLNYYTGTVFEGFLNDGREIGVTSSICAGGRYDDIIGKFAAEASGSQEPRKIPAVGISFGLDVLLESLKAKGTTLDESAGGLDAFVVPIGDALPAAIAACQKLRSVGCRTGIDLGGKGVSKNIAYAAKKGARYAVIIGAREAAEGKATLRDLASGEEKLLTVEQVANALGKPSG